MSRQFWGWKKLEGEIQRFEKKPFTFWNNPTYLPYRRGHIAESTLPWITPEEQKNPIDVDQFTPDLFPLIEDFEIMMCKIFSSEEQKEDDFFYNLQFFSPSRGFLGNPLRLYNSGPESVPPSFCSDDFVIPCGNFLIPYYDFGQSFAVLIAEQDDFVYIARGVFEEVDTKGYERWFKVERNRYFSQWEQVIQLCRRHCNEPIAS